MLCKVPTSTHTGLAFAETRLFIISTHRAESLIVVLLKQQVEILTGQEVACKTFVLGGQAAAGYVHCTRGNVDGWRPGGLIEFPLKWTRPVWTR